MKSIIKTLNILLAILLVRTISSCCSDPDQNVSGKVYFTVMGKNGSEAVQKIELIGANKTIQIESANTGVTLNPNDTISSYRVYYSSGNKIVTLAYTKTVNFHDNFYCKNTVDVEYNARLANPTMNAGVSVMNNYGDGVQVKIIL